jgi:O-antigen/teichoic acid export membrane protein
MQVFAHVRYIATDSEQEAFSQTDFGFFLMAGFMTGFSAVIALLLFIFALTQDPYLIGSFDILALILSLFALDSRRPGVDDIIGIPDYLHIKKIRE